MPPFTLRKLLAFRAAGMLLLGYGVPTLAMYLIRLLQHDEVQSLANGHPDALLGVVNTLIVAAVDIWQQGSFIHLFCAVAGAFLLRADPDRLRRLCSRLESA